MKDMCDVLVVGCGPVGATLAGLLGQQGVKVIAIERAPQIYPLPRAAHFDHEIMRVFQSLGIADAVQQHARPAGPYEFRSGDGRLLMITRQGADRSVSGWANAYMFNQPGTERALRARLADLPSVDVRLGWSFERLEQDAERVTATVSGPDGEHSITARYIVGCDGAWSPVRAAVGIELEDYGFDEPWLVVDTIPDDPNGMPHVNLQLCDPARPTTCVHMGPGRHRWEFMLLPGETAEDVMAEGFVEDLLAKWNVSLTIERKAVYRFHALVAKAWRAGRVLIAGDAAHQMPPFAGQGMCSGIRDATNLAWKLAAILSGEADDALLDSYQAEREANVRSYIAIAIEMGRVVCTLDPVAAAQRDAMMIAMLEAGQAPMPPVVKPGVEGGAMLAGDPLAADIFPQFVAEDGGPWLDDVLGPGAWLIARGRTGDAPGMKSVALDDALLAPFLPALEAWFAQHAVSAVLVRPDRYVFGTGTPERLLQSWAGALHASSAKIAA